MIEAQLMEHGGVGIINSSWILPVKRFVSPLIALPMSHASVKSTSGKPVSKDERIMIPALTSLTARHPTKLGGPVYNCILEQTALLQIL